MAAKRILVVDDSSSVRRELARILTAGGFEVVEAGDGQQGAELVEQDASIGLVISDLHMPIMNGLEMLARIKSQPQYASLRVLIVTSEVQADFIRQAKTMGASGWLVKPFSASKVLLSVEKLLAQA